MLWQDIRLCRKHHKGNFKIQSAVNVRFWYRWVGKSGLVSWLPINADLIPLDFFQVGDLRQLGDTLLIDSLYGHAVSYLGQNRMPLKSLPGCKRCWNRDLFKDVSKLQEFSKYWKVPCFMPCIIASWNWIVFLWPCVQFYPYLLVDKFLYCPVWEFFCLLFTLFGSTLSYSKSLSTSEN